MNIDFFRQDVHSGQLNWYGSILDVNDIEPLRRIAQCEEPNEFDTYAHRWITGSEKGYLSTQSWPHKLEDSRDLTVVFLQESYGKGRVSFSLFGAPWTLLNGEVRAALPTGKQMEGTLKK